MGAGAVTVAETTDNPAPRPVRCRAGRIDRDPVGAPSPVLTPWDRDHDTVTPSEESAT
ncbi:hypothetical protein ATKI12_4641 [Kitasatospora sp. Ki12]